MESEWDPKKAATNWRKHKVRFAEAATVLDDTMALTIEDTTHNELRSVTVGSDSTGRVLVVVWTMRGENVRIISARKATARERKDYYRKST